MSEFTREDLSRMLGARIKELREKKKMTQQELADYAGTTRATVSKWETGDSEPGATQLRLIAEALGVSVDYLCGNDASVGERICVLDTCIVLNRPRVIDLLVKTSLYNKIVIPDVVTDELNYQKDHAKGSNKQRAWLAMVTIERQKDHIAFDKTEYNKGEINDEKIMAVAKKYALVNINNVVDILTNDVYFSLKHKTFGIKNLSIKSFADIEASLYKSDIFDEYETQKFLGAVKSNKLSEVKRQYKESVDVNRVDSHSGQTPLIIAIRAKNHEILEYLLSIEGIDVEKRDSDKYAFTPLLHACQMKDLGAMKILIENGANVNSSSRGVNKGNTPLMVCSWKYPFIEGIKLLMESDELSYNQQDNNGFTALHKACYWNQYEVIKLLIDKVDNNIEDFNNRKAVELLDKKNQNFARISALFNR